MAKTLLFVATERKQEPITKAYLQNEGEGRVLNTNKQAMSRKVKNSTKLTTRDHVPNYKIAFVGAPESGKTGVFTRYVYNQFDAFYKSTKAPVIENVVKAVNTGSTNVVSMCVWDLPGREPLDMRRSYYRDLDAAVVVVDLSDTSSIELAGAWKQEVLNQVTMTPKRDNSVKPSVVSDVDRVEKKGYDIPVLLLGTKYDKIPQNVLRVEPSEQEILDGDLKGQPIVKNKPYLETPDCVKLLNKVGADHGFVASVAVSAKLNDGSVDGAINGLLRFLMSRNQPFMTNAWDKNNTKTTNESSIPAVLVRINIPQLDAVFDHCDELLRFTNKLRCCHQFSFAKFREVCYSHDLVESTNASLEDCIIGIKDFVPEGYQLLMTEEDGFCQLTLDIKESTHKIKKELKQAIKCFNTEYAAISKTIIRHSAKLIESFHAYDSQIATLCNNVNIRDYVTNTTNIDIVQNKLQRSVEYNRGVLDHYRTQLESSVTQVHNNVEKVANALMWAS